MFRGLVVVVLIILTVIAALWAVQRRLIYLPDRSSPSVPDAPVAVEEVSYKTDGLVLNAWYLRASGDHQGAVIVFPGNAGHRADRLPLGVALAEVGYSTLLVDYRGYGGNAGSPSEEGLQADARAALAYVHSRAEVDAGSIAYFGESLGSGVALQLAVDHPPAALILRSPFTSLTDVAATHYPFLPVSLLLRDRYSNIDVISGITTPLLVVAGSEDRIVPADLSRRLFDAATDPKQLLVVEGARHNDLALLAGAELIDEVVSFLDGELG